MEKNSLSSGMAVIELAHFAVGFHVVDSQVYDAEINRFWDADMAVRSRFYN